MQPAWPQKHGGPGRYYLVIDGANTNWSVQVADSR